MAWSKSEAEAYMAGKTFDELETKDESQHQEVENTSTEGNVEPSVDETDKSDTSNDSSIEENSTSPVIEENLEKVDNTNKDKKGQKKYSDIEKQRHAFAKEKNKRKEIEAALNAKNKEIEELKDKLKKYEGLSLENFNGDNEAYTEYKIDQRFNREKIDRLQNEYNQQQMQYKMEEAERISNERLMNNFPEEEDRNNYQNLVMRAENDYKSMHPEMGVNKFSDLLLEEEDKTILNYLQDSDNSPKLIRHFIHKPEVVLKIMSMRNPYNKVAELRMLEQRMLQHERMMKSKSNVSLNTPKRELSNTGKSIVNNNMGSSIDYNKPWSKADAEAYMKRRNK